MSDSTKRKPGSASFVDLTRLLDSGVLTLFTVLLSCTFLFMFGELLRLLNNAEFLNNDLVKRGMNRLFPFRVFF
ncbi:hypothetical protein MACJ_004097 [Theileria orientalis]|uniref:Uncharacterized protein n=1 Tax=Theileria orientalis TaxID=68886 RepID=A0A976XKK6_THEOR|nr:hypothetical protein MACJ_004097 [Theileria orientalis]